MVAKGYVILVGMRGDRFFHLHGHKTIPKNGKPGFMVNGDDSSGLLLTSMLKGIISDPTVPPDLNLTLWPRGYTSLCFVTLLTLEFLVKIVSPRENMWWCISC